jgi:hypothetical protein
VIILTPPGGSAFGTEVVDVAEVADDWVLPDCDCEVVCPVWEVDCLLFEVVEEAEVVGVLEAVSDTLIMFL